jgi:cobalt-zinc-cadmium resistance protein CzcA
MLNAIIGFSIRNKLIVGLLTLGLVGFGVVELTRLPIDAVPDITNNQVQVITVAPSFGATDIERLVTFPVEQAMSNIHGIIEMRSFSRFGLSLVTIVFDDDTDVYWARQQVSERLAVVQSQIPKGIDVPVMGPISTGLGEIYQYVVRPAPGYEGKYSLTDLRTIQDWLVRRQLLRVDGVAEVSSFGGNLRQIEIAIDPLRIASLNVTVDDVFQSLERSNQNAGGAYIERGPVAWFIRTEGLFTSVDEVGDVVVRTQASGAPLLLRDVADITEGHAIRFGAMCYNNEGEVSGGIVMMMKGANSSDVISDVKKKVEEIRTSLPEGILIEPFLDRTKMVNNAISTVQKNLLEGALIVVFILVLFLGNFRAGLLVASVIPLAMLFAVIMMNLFGVSGNLMSLGALDFGLIIDGAVIIVEAVLHQVHRLARKNPQRGLTKPEMDGEVLFSAGKMMNSAVFGQAIILIVYLPILSLEGIEGKMFRPMAQTVAFALLGAFLLSLTYVPMMSSIVLSRKTRITPGPTERAMAWLETKYRKALSKSLRYPAMVFSSAAVLFVIALFILSRMGGEFIPTLEEGDFAVDTRVLTGSNISHTIDQTQRAAALLIERFPEVEKIVTKIGSGEVPTDPMPMEASDMMIILKDKSEWTSAKTFPELEKKMSETLAEIPGISYGFQFPVQMRFNELMTGARQDVVCKLFGEDLDTLAHYAALLGDVVTQVDGAQDLYIEPVTGVSQIVVTYDKAALKRYGLDVSTLNQNVSLAMAGASAGQLYEGEKRFDLVVRLADEFRTGVEGLGQIPVALPDGSQIPLGEVADFTLTDGPNQIQREDAQRRIVVGFNVGDRDVQSVVNELRAKVENDLRLPPGYRIAYGGVFENLEAARSRLLIAVPIALLLIFVLLYFAFHSLRQGIMVFSAIPLSAIGGVFLLQLRGMPFSISAGIGFIALFGVAVLNGIVLLAEFNARRKAGLTNPYRVVIEGASSRLRPVLMTAAVASMGFLPMALSHGSGAEVQRPLATVVIGGLLIATFLTLFLLPALYAFRGFSRRKVRRVAAAILMLTLGTTAAQAQIQVDLSAALDSAMRGNHSLESARLRAAQAAALIRTGRDVPPTSVTLDYGQYNSIYMDNRIGVTQAFRFPSYYTAQQDALRAAARGAEEESRLRALELRVMIQRSFYRLLVLEELQRVLNESLAVQEQFTQVIESRVNAGKGNAMDLLLARNALNELSTEIARNALELMQERERLRVWMNVRELPYPASSSSRMDMPVMTDQAVMHPLLAMESQRVTQAAMRERTERRAALPELELGFYSTSITGTGADDVRYSSGDRFNAFYAGLGIPLFYGAQRARIAGAALEVQIAESQLNQTQLMFLSEKVMASQELAQSAQLLGRYDEGALRDAEEMKALAAQQLENGAISYTEWAFAVQQSLRMYREYYSTLERWNNAAIHIQFYYPIK